MEPSKFDVNMTRCSTDVQFIYTNKCIYNTRVVPQLNTVAHKKLAHKANYEKSRQVQNCGANSVHKNANSMKPCAPSCTKVLVYPTPTCSLCVWSCFELLQFVSSMDRYQHARSITYRENDIECAFYTLIMAGWV